MPDPALLSESVAEQINIESTRLVGENDVTQVYVAEGSNAAQICLVQTIPDASMAASACIDKDQFYTDGLSIGLSGGEGQPNLAADAYLLPPDVDEVTDAVTSEGSQDEQLILVGAGESQPSATDFVRVGDAADIPFEFTPLD